MRGREERDLEEEEEKAGEEEENVHLDGEGEGKQQHAPELLVGEEENREVERQHQHRLVEQTQVVDALRALGETEEQHRPST